MQNFSKRKKPAKTPKIKAEDAKIISEEKTIKTNPNMAKQTPPPVVDDQDENTGENNSKPNKKEKTQTPTEEQKPPTQEFKDPLTESEPIVPEYAKVQVEGQHNYEPIPEEPIERPTINFRDDNQESINDNFKSSVSTPPPSQQQPNKAEQQQKSNIGNPDLADKTLKEKREGSKYFAQTIVDGYEALHIACQQWLEKSDPKLMKMAMKGKIEIEVLDSEVDFGGGTIIRIKQIIDEYNTTIKEVLTVSPEFKNEILPLLEAELLRRNIGMTTMQRIIAVVVKDLQPKIMKVIQMTTMLSAVLEAQSSIFRQQKEIIAQQQQNATGGTIVIEDTNTPYTEPNER